MSSNFDWKKPFFSWCNEYRFLRGILFGDQAEKFGAKYLEMLRKWNASINLMGNDELEKFWERHWLDSLKGIFFIREEKIIDFGSGAGFPGLPIVLFLSNLRLICVEKVAKKRTFISELAHELGVEKRVTVVSTLQEALDMSQGPAIEICTRAVKPMDVVLELSQCKNTKYKSAELIYWGELPASVAKEIKMTGKFEISDQFYKPEPLNISVLKMFHVEHS